MIGMETRFDFGRSIFEGQNSVAEAPNIEDAIKLAGLDWTVSKRQVGFFNAGNNPDEDDFLPIPEQYAVMRDTDDRFFGFVGDRYKPLQNTEVFSFVDELMGNGVRIETAGMFYNGRIWVQGRTQDSKIIMGDKIDPYVVFTTSHDGKHGINGCITPIRVICQNTLNAAFKKADRVWRITHNGDLQAKITEARKTLLHIDAYMDEMENFAETSQQVKISDDAIHGFIKKAFPMEEKDTDRKKANVLEARESFLYVLNEKEDLQKFRGTGWGLINAVADFVPHFKAQRLTDKNAETSILTAVDGSKLMQIAQEIVSKSV